MEGTQRAEATFGGTAEQALRDINHTTNHYYADRQAPITPGTSVAPPLGRLNHKVRGRSGLVAALTDDLGGSIAVLAGAGGFGKTTTALEAVRNLPRVWWVDASSKDSLVAGLAEVALQAGGDPHEVREAWAGRGGSAIELVWRNLDHQATPWVLVLDNADDPGVLAATGQKVGDGNGWLRVPTSNGSVLVTSRTSTGWPPAARVHHVRQLDPEDGAQVLLDLADAGDRQDAESLSRRLGGLPLALRLAGRYLAVAQDALALPGLEPTTTFKTYQERWDERFTELTEAASPRESLSRTWEMSMDLLAERGQPQTRHLLRLVSAFAEAPVPAFVLDATIMAESDLLKPITAAQLSLLLKALQEVGLLDLVGSNVIIHPVIRSANRHQPDYEQNENVYGAVVARLLRTATKELNRKDPATWPRWHAVLPHLTDLGSYGDPELDLESAALLRHGAGFVEEIGAYDASESLYRRAIALSRVAVGDDHQETFDARHALGHLLDVKGDLTGAEEEHRTLLADEVKALGPDNANTLNTRNCLARVLMDRGRWDEAEAEYSDVLAERIRTVGPTARATLTTRHDLAHLLETRGRLAEAEVTLRQVIEAVVERLGREHTEVLDIRCCLADILKRRGQLAEAEAELRDLLAMRAREVPPPLDVRLRLADVLRCRGRLDDAEAEYRALAAESARFYGAEHPRTLSARHGLVHVLAARGDYAAAQEEHRGVLDAQERLFGATHPSTLRTRACLAHIYRAQKRFHSAETEYREVLAVRERMLGPDHVLVLEVLHRLAHVRGESGDLAAAERDHVEVIERQERALGPLHPDTVMSRHCLADLMRELGRIEDAETAYRSTLALETQIYGVEHENAVTTRYRLAEVLAELGRRDEAEAEYRAVLEIEERTLGAEHPNTVKTGEKLAALTG